MGILVIVANKVFERFQVSPDHYETELAGAVCARCPGQHLNYPVRFPHQRDRSLVEKLTKLLFFCQALL
jgi:hypothetical protein